ncbi:hypothetical protein ACVNF4_06255 [Streptomyces sp. S6]
MNDPVHLAGDDVILPHIQRMGAVRASDDADPEIREKVAALHGAKLARYPEWERQLETVPETRF